MSEGREAPNQQMNDPEEIDLLDLLALMIRRRWIIAGVIVALAVLGGWNSKRNSGVTYVAQISLYLEGPPPAEGSKGPVLGSDVIKGFELGKLMMGRKIANPEISGDSLSLGEYLDGTMSIPAAHQALLGRTEIRAFEPGYVTLSVEDPNSSVARDIALEYFTALRKHYVDGHAAIARKELGYIDTRLAEVEDQLAIFEDSLLVFRERNNIGRSKGRLETGNFLEINREWTKRMRQVNSWRAVHEKLLSRREDILIQGQSGSPKIKVLGDVVVRTVPKNRFSMKVGVATGAGAGLVAGMMLAYVLEYVARRRRDGGIEKLIRAYKGESV